MGAGILTMISLSGVAQLNSIQLKKLKLTNIQRRVARVVGNVQRQLDGLGTSSYGGYANASCMTNAMSQAASIGVFVPGFNLNNPFCPNYGNEIRGVAMQVGSIGGKGSNAKDDIAFILDNSRMASGFAYELGNKDKSAALIKAGYTPDTSLSQNLAKYYEAGDQKAKDDAFKAIVSNPNFLLFMGRYIEDMGGNVRQPAAGNLFVFDHEKLNAANSFVEAAKGFDKTKGTDDAGFKRLAELATSFGHPLSVVPSVEKTALDAKVAAEGLAKTAWDSAPAGDAKDVAQKAFEAAQAAVKTAQDAFNAAKPSPVDIDAAVQAAVAVATNIITTAGTAVKDTVWGAAAPSPLHKKADVEKDNAAIITGMQALIAGGNFGEKSIAIMQHNKASARYQLEEGLAVANGNNTFQTGLPGQFSRYKHERIENTLNEHLFDKDDNGKTLESEQKTDLYMLSMNEARDFIEYLQELVGQKQTEVDTELMTLNVEEQIIKTQTQQAQQKIPEALQLVLGGGR